MEELLDAPTLARTLRIAPQTLARWRTEGQGPEWIRVGRRVLYSPKEVERWLSSRRRRSTSDIGPDDRP